LDIVCNLGKIVYGKGYRETTKSELSIIKLYKYATCLVRHFFIKKGFKIIINEVTRSRKSNVGKQYVQ
jgi:hypothetical protein